MLKFILTLLIFPMLICAEEAVLILNTPNDEALPRNFRTCNDPFKEKSMISREGLDSLLMSGSAQFSELGFNLVLKKIKYEKGPLIVVDLRQESHGFLNGIAISWFTTGNAINRNKSSSQIKMDEQKLLEALKSQKEAKITKVLSFTKQDVIDKVSISTEPVRSVSDEEAIVKKQKALYFRIYVADHQAPSDAQVDEFLAFVKQLKPNTWLHFHCEAGKGRTTTFMSMYDMMHNAKNVSLDEIVKRQEALHPAGYNVLKLKSPDKFDYAYNKARGEFLREFYNYAKENADNFQTSWTSYKVSTSSRLPAPRFGGAMDLQSYPGLRFAYPGLIAVTPFGSDF